MSRVATAFAVGLLFGAGLIISQMSNPAKVIGFLDVTRAWDPSLALVMAGAVAVFAMAYRFSLKRGAPLLAVSFSTPVAQGLNWRLIIGASIFGVGWGLGGFCPGPAVVGAAFGDARVWTFIVSMIAGMGVFHWLQRAKSAPR